MTSREKLIGWEDVYDHEGTSEIFMESMRDCLKHHMDNNDFLNKLKNGVKNSEESLKHFNDLVQSKVDKEKWLLQLENEKAEMTWAR